MLENEANLGDDGCPWGVAPAVEEQPFFGRPIRSASFVDPSCCTGVSPWHSCRDLRCVQAIGEMWMQLPRRRVIR